MVFVCEEWAFFATVDVNGDSTSTRVTESFEVRNVTLTDPFAVSDSSGNNNGFPEPGEEVMLSIPVENKTGKTINNVQVTVNNGSNVSYGNMTDGQTVTMQFPYTIPSGEACGSNHQVTINVTSDIGPRPTFTRSFILGQPNPPSSIITENFDGVTAPALPGDWKSTLTGIGSGWATRTDSPNSSPNSVFAADVDNIGQSFLETDPISINSSIATLKFKMNFNLENEPVQPTLAYDGVVLDIKIGAKDYSDINVAGGNFVSNGYNTTVSTSFGSQIGGRMAWSGNSGGYVDVEVTIPPTANGENVQFRWNMATDGSISAVGVDIDDVEVSSTTFTCSPITPTKPIFDFDGDGKTDVSIFRPNVGEWWYLRSSDLDNRALQFGSSSDIPTPADFTGDGKTDISFFRNGEWFVLRSEDDSFFSFPWGQDGDIPAPGDFDGDGKADPTVFRPNDSTWFILKSTDNNVDIIPFGIAEDKPVIADYDGDGKDDIAIYRPSVSQWWINQSTEGVTALQFGSNGDRTVQGDYTGDGKADVAFFRPSLGEWFIIRSEDNSFFSFPFGATGDIAAPGDYDGDGVFDATVFRPSSTTWFVNGTQSGVQIVGFGLDGDIPVPSVFSVP